MLRQTSHSLWVRASRPGLHEFTMSVEAWVRASGIREGLLTIFCRHTSASLLIQENADPAVARDLEKYFASLAPTSASYEHADEGEDDMPAHLRAALTQSHLSIPVRNRRTALGRWQGIFLFEHRSGTPEREVVLQLIGS